MQVTQTGDAKGEESRPEVGPSAGAEFMEEFGRERCAFWRGISLKNLEPFYIKIAVSCTFFSLARAATPGQF